MNATMLAQSMIFTQYQQPRSSVADNGKMRATQAARILCGLIARHDVGSAKFIVGYDSSRQVDQHRNEAILPNGCLVTFDTTGSAGKVAELSSAAIVAGEYFLVLRLAWDADPNQAATVHLVELTPGISSAQYQYQNDLILAWVTMEAFFVCSQCEPNTRPGGKFGVAKEWPIERVGSQRGVMGSILVSIPFASNMGGTDPVPTLRHAEEDSAMGCCIIPEGFAIDSASLLDALDLTIYAEASLIDEDPTGVRFDILLDKVDPAQEDAELNISMTVDLATLWLGKKRGNLVSKLDIVDLSRNPTAGDPSDFNPGDYIKIRIMRMGNHIDDTCPSPLRIYCASIRMTRRWIGEEPKLGAGVVD